jgi:hypothetical protein
MRDEYKMLKAYRFFLYFNFVVSLCVLCDLCGLIVLGLTLLICSRTHLIVLIMSNIGR